MGRWRGGTRRSRRRDLLDSHSLGVYDFNNYRFGWLTGNRVGSMCLCGDWMEAEGGLLLVRLGF